MSDDRLTVLVSEYEQCREDERAFHSAIATVYTVGVALLAGLATYVSRGTPAVPQPVLALAPLVPLALFAYCVPIGLLATVRSYHARELESELLRLAPSRGETPGATPPWATLVSGVHSLRVRPNSAYGMLSAAAYGVIMLAALITFGGAVFYLGSEVQPEWRSVMAAVYVPMLTVILGALYVGSQRGPQLFAFARASAGRAHAKSGERGTFSYFLLPRPGDLIKAPFVLLGIWIGWLVADAGPRQSGAGWWAVTALALIVVELMAYQARYQWNDIRGATEDAAHHRRAGRRRLPVAALGLRAAVALSLTTMSLRVFTAVALALGGWWGTREELLLIVAAIWGLGAAYEFVRSKGWALLTAFVVTLGYPLRVLAGLLVAGARPSDAPALFWAVVLSAMAFGLTFVSLTWAHEGVDVAASTRGERPLKPHLALFMSHVPRPVFPQRPLEPRGPVSAPWNVGLVVALAALGTGLAVAEAAGDWVPRFGGLATMLGSAVLMTAALSTRWRLAVLGGTAGAAALLLGKDAGAATLPLLCTGVTYLAVYVSFRASNYGEMMSTLERVQVAASRALRAVQRAFLGQQTAAAVSEPVTPPAPPPGP